MAQFEHGDIVVRGSMLSLLILWAGLSSQQPASSAGQMVTLPSFQQYSVAQIYRGKPAAPVFRTKEELEFRTRIRQGAAKGPNFAGHYAIVEWGGGTGTGHFVVVDVKTGEIYFHADPNKGIEFLFSVKSRLMAINAYMGPPDAETCVRSFWEWTGKEMKFIAKFSGKHACD